MVITLKRYGSTPKGTFGELHIGNSVFYTVEQPWRDNRENESCVPNGFYRLEPHDSEMHRNTFALINEDIGVYHYPAANSTRFAILIHAGNTMNDVSGCISPGMELADHWWGVRQSRIAMDEIRKLLRRGFYAIEIEWQTFNWV